MVSFGSLASLSLTVHSRFAPIADTRQLAQWADAVENVSTRVANTDSY